jgi:hypothetical protein
VPTAAAEGWALEGLFKAVQGPRVVVLDTRSVLIESEREWSSPAGRERSWEPNGPRRDAAPRNGTITENPLLQCGVLMAGCNRAQDGDREDGVLSAQEIVRTDLRGTELIVLGACDTGADARRGDAFGTLQQAFQIAGAESVLASQWPAPEADEARLLAGFFEALAAGPTKAEALRQAQLRQIRARRAQTGAAHPLFWAAPTLTTHGL